MDTKKPDKILIVEDEIITAKAIEQSLEDLGYDVVGIVASGTEAIRKATLLKPNLVLMDVKLRGVVDGVFATQRIQAHLDIPVVYLTAHSDDETVKRVMHSGPYGYITKPFKEAELDHAVKRALERHKAKRQAKNHQQH